MDQIAATPPAFPQLIRASQAARGLFHRSPVFATLTAEKLIAARWSPKDALRVLDIARERSPAVEKDFRYRQLMGLCHSRAGRLDEAVPWLTGMSHDFMEDPETVGILGGVYKRRYLAAKLEGREAEATEWLRKSIETYDAGWQASKPSNHYLGINVAALSLWRGDLPAARATAQTIASELEDLRKSIEAGPVALRDCFDLWDELSLLEAWLVLGRFDEARAGLARIEAQPGGSRHADIATFREQARRNMRALRELGATDLREDYFGG
jgi:ATP/maltotriose-dependent transcriptional regulator MalT